LFSLPSVYEKNLPIVINLMSVDEEGIILIQGDSEDEFDWEEVDLPLLTLAEHQPQHHTSTQSRRKLLPQISWLSIFVAEKLVSFWLGRRA
jgi:hypothetical protein